MLVDMVIEDPRWQAVGLAEVAERAGRAALEAAGRAPDGCEISLLACDDARMAALNAAFRGKATPTNVLAWPAAGGLAGEGEAAAKFLGDIALGFETCRREAAAGGIAIEAHLGHLVAHGVLHLVGYGHETAAEAEAMEALETKILANIGVANPYC